VERGASAVGQRYSPKWWVPIDIAAQGNGSKAEVGYVEVNQALASTAMAVEPSRALETDEL
jgi:hypothetical protein